MRGIGQKNMGQQWGVFAQTAGQLSIFIGVINLLLLSATAYNTTLSAWFTAYGIPLNFWMFMCIIAFLLVVTSVVLYKYALPSFFSFFNDQFYRHDNLLRHDIELLKKDNKAILEILKGGNSNDKVDV